MIKSNDENVNEEKSPVQGKELLNGQKTQCISIFFREKKNPNKLKWREKELKEKKSMFIFYAFLQPRRVVRFSFLFRLVCWCRIFFFCLFFFFVCFVWIVQLDRSADLNKTSKKKTTITAFYTDAYKCSNVQCMTLLRYYCLVFISLSFALFIYCLYLCA